MNRRGVVGIGTAWAIVVGILVVGAAIRTPEFRKQKALEKCQAVEPAGTDCNAFVAQLIADGGLKGAKPEYIRDK